MYLWELNKCGVEVDLNLTRCILFGCPDFSISSKSTPSKLDQAVVPCFVITLG